MLTSRWPDHGPSPLVLGGPSDPLPALRAAGLRERAAELAQGAARLGGALDRVHRCAVAAAWAGPVRDAFTETLLSQRLALTRAAAVLQAEHDRLRALAARQEQGQPEPGSLRW